MYPIPDQEIKRYINRVLEDFTTEQIRDVLAREYTYRNRIKAKIKVLSNQYAERVFDDLIRINQLIVRPNWSFKPAIVPGKIGAPITNSLYEREGDMNDFEQEVVMSIASFSNVQFWHRNLGRGKGFSINGFQSDHYPDFIIGTKQGNIILLETKGGHLDNADSAAKVRLGNRWAQLAGERFHYFMVFRQKEVDGALRLERAKELLRQL